MSERKRTEVTYEVEELATAPTKRSAMRMAREFDKDWPQFAPHRVYRVTTTITRERVSHADR